MPDPSYTNGPTPDRQLSEDSFEPIAETAMAKLPHSGTVSLDGYLAGPRGDMTWAA